MCSIWYVMFSSWLWMASVREIMSAILPRTTASVCNGLPNALRWLIQLVVGRRQRRLWDGGRLRLYLQHTFLDDGALRACGRAAHDPSLVVEVAVHWVNTENHC